MTLREENDESVRIDNSRKNVFSQGLESSTKLTLGIGNIEPNMATDSPAVAPMATIARHFGAPT